MNSHEFFLWLNRYLEALESEGITEYIETNEMSYEHKIKDLDILIQYFEEQERYEDCALILEVKKQVEKRKLLTKIQGNE